MGVMVGDADLPRPPKKSSRPQSSVRSSPRYTGVPWKAPSNVQSAPPAFLPRLVRAPPSITSPSRAPRARVALRALDGAPDPAVRAPSVLAADGAGAAVDHQPVARRSRDGGVAEGEG